MIKRTKLSFKGDVKDAKPPPIKSKGDEELIPCDDALESETHNSWVPVSSIDNLVGPLWFTFSTQGQRYSLSFSESETTNLIPLLPTDLQPVSSSQILVGQFVGDRDHFAMKNAHGRFIGHDRHGLIEWKKEAIGPHEIWIPIFDSTTQTIKFKRRPDLNECEYEHYLLYDINYRQFRADIDSIEKATAFSIFYQASRMKKPTKVLPQLASIDISNYEEDQLRKYVSWYDSKYENIKKKIHSSKHELQFAEKEGSLHSALLNRREKLKSDKYCK